MKNGFETIAQKVEDGSIWRDAIDGDSDAIEMLGILNPEENFELKVAHREFGACQQCGHCEHF